MSTLFPLRRILAAPLLVLALAVPAFAATYYVSPSGSDSNPGTSALPFATIEHAVNAASSGDTVTLQNGTYSGDGNHDIELGGKNLTVKSVNGAASTIIDCQGQEFNPQRGFYIHQGETAAVISGLTIEHGAATYYDDDGGTDSGYGGGICIDNSTVSLQNCVITGNAAYSQEEGFGSEEGPYVAGYGGGVYSSNANGGTTTLTGCTISNNAAVGGGGGGMENDASNSSTTTLTNCTFSGNAVYGGNGDRDGGQQDSGTGGGIDNSCGDATITMTGCIINGNTANGGGDTDNGYDSAGGGVYNGVYGSGSVTMTGCTISGNSAPFSNGFGGNQGGGVYNTAYDTAAITLTSCSLTGNSAYDGGGGVFDGINSADAAITFTDCKLLSNTTPTSGGGLYQANGVPTLTNCTVFGNAASGGQGGGIYNNAGSGVTAVNCTLTQNSAPDGQGGSVYSASGTVTLTNDILYGDSGGEIAYTGTAPAVTYCDVDGGFTGTHNIDADPLFTRTPNLSAMPPDYGDLRLQATSPCLGAGNHAVAPATDKTGVTRPNPPSIGAFEAYAVLTSLSFNPATVAGGSVNTTGTVTLNNPASAGGATVSLSSSSGTITFSAPSVTIAAGTTTATFRAYSHTVSSTKTVTVTATYLGTSKVANVTVTPSTALSSLSFSPTTVAGGMVNTTGTVTLTGAAPSGGTVVSLASSNGAITFASSTVTVAAGATTATFRAYSHTVTSTKTVTVTATLNGVSKTATVTVTPAMASATLSSLSFSPTTVKGGSANTTGTVTLTSAAPSGGSVVSLGSSNAAITFPASTVTVAAGATSATFRAYSHHVSSTQHVTVTAVLSGTSKAATITVTP